MGDQAERKDGAACRVRSRPRQERRRSTAPLFPRGPKLRRSPVVHCSLVLSFPFVPRESARGNGWVFDALRLFTASTKAGDAPPKSAGPVDGGFISLLESARKLVYIHGADRRFSTRAFTCR